MTPANGSAARTGIANLPLHGGKAPPWLFNRMVKLAREITIFIVTEHGPEEMLRRMSDPFWFQAFGCVLGFDWHSSGVTTTLCGALKEGLKEIDGDLGLYVCGGKGRTSRRTPAEIESHGDAISVDPAGLVYASRMSAKVDNSALQDGYQLYHHTFIFTRKGSWAVVQQGMNNSNHYARRYHWLGEKMSDFVCEPHAAICAPKREETLNLTAVESTEARNTIRSIATEQSAERLLTDLKRLKTLDLPRRHFLTLQDIHPDRLKKGIHLINDRQPGGFEELLGLEGVGPKTVRALSLISELVYGVPSSFRDPARFSFAHGGKDGHPFPVDRETYDRSITLLAQAVEKAKIDGTEKTKAINRLNKGFLGNSK